MFRIKTMKYFKSALKNGHLVLLAFSGVLDLGFSFVFRYKA